MTVDLFGEPLPTTDGAGLPLKRDGWTGWSADRLVIYERHGLTHQVHWPKLNRTDHFSAAGELVGESKWGVHGCWYRARELRAGEAPHEPDLQAIAGRMMAALGELRARNRADEALQAREAERLAAAAAERERAKAEKRARRKARAA